MIGFQLFKYKKINPDTTKNQKLKELTTLLYVNEEIKMNNK